MKGVDPIDYASPSTPSAHRRVGRDVAIGLLTVITGLPLLALGLLASILASGHRGQLGDDPWAPPGRILGADWVLGGVRRMIWGPPPP